MIDGMGEDTIETIGRAQRHYWGENKVIELVQLIVPPSIFGLEEGPKGMHCKIYDVLNVMGQRTYRDLGVPAHCHYGRDVNHHMTNTHGWLTASEAEAHNERERARYNKS